MDARPSLDRDYESGPSDVATAYRFDPVGATRQATGRGQGRGMGWSPYAGAPIGMGVDGIRTSLVLRDVREVIQWAGRPWRPMRGRPAAVAVPFKKSAYVIYAKVLDEDLWLQVAGRHPVL